MANDDLTIAEDITPQDRTYLEDRLYEYNVAATRIADGQLLSIVLRDGGGAVKAGLYGWTWGGCLEIDLLWVREDQRGSGLGSRLVAAAEHEAIRRGCRQALLSTHSFQAPAFYHKLGYEVYGVIDDYPAGFRCFHLRKTLSA